MYLCSNTILIINFSFSSVIYRHVWIHDAKSRQTFELMCIYAEKFSRSLPISFLVGFYVSQVVSRWWQQFNSLPWPDQLALKLANFVPDTVRHLLIHLNLGRLLFGHTYTLNLDYLFELTYFSG